VPLYFTTDGKFISPGRPLVSISGAQAETSGTTNNQPSTYADVSEDDDAVQGNANAPVTIIEFSDFQCPFCEKFFTDTLPQIEANYIKTGKVKLIYRDFPLEIHQYAGKAAEAAECARDKGGDSAFWKMHDKIFENQASLSEDNLKKWAKELGYNIDSCLDGGKKKAEVQKDLADGIAAGISGTPSFFINGKLIEGAVPYNVFESEINSALNNK